MNFSFLTRTWNKLLYGWDLIQIGNTLLIIPDFSHWSVLKPPKIDEEKFARQCAEKGVKFIIYKGTDSWQGQLFTDVTAPFWWGLAERLGLGRGTYHWLQPGVDPTVAFNYHRDYVRTYPTELPYLMDFEEKKISSATDYLWRAYTWLGLADADRGDKTVIYSAPWYINLLKTMIPSSDWEKKMGMLRNWPLWLATYSRYWPSKKSLWPWTDFVGWQYSDAADFPYYKDDDQYWGTEWGIQSSGLDMNYFRREWLEKYLPGEKQPPIEEPPAEEPPQFPTMETLKYRTLSEMRVRSAPTTSMDNTKRITQKGEELSVMEISGNDAWIYVGDGWVCKTKNGREYLEKI